MLGNGQVVHAGPDPARVHAFDELIPRDAAPLLLDHDGIQVMSVACIDGRVCGKAERETSKLSLVLAPYLAPQKPVALHPRKLVDAQCRLQVHHVVLETALHHLVVLVALVTKTVPGIFAHAVQCQYLCARDV